MAFVEMSDLMGLPTRRRVRPAYGLGQLGQAGGPGVLASYAVYPTSAAALAKGYGAFYQQGGQYYMTGPYGPLQITDTSTIYPSFTGRYGIFYRQNGVLSVSGPKGQIAVNTKLTPSAAPAAPAAPQFTPVSAPAPAPSSGTALVAYTIPGGIQTAYVIYPDGATALKAGYGRFYQQGGQYYSTGPYGPLQIADTGNVYSAFTGRYGHPLPAGQHPLRQRPEGPDRCDLAQGRCLPGWSAERPEQRGELHSDPGSSGRLPDRADQRPDESPELHRQPGERHSSRQRAPGAADGRPDPGLRRPDGRGLSLLHADADPS